MLYDGNGQNDAMIYSFAVDLQLLNAMRVQTHANADIYIFWTGRPCTILPVMLILSTVSLVWP
jgi:hypothetical protein